MRSIQYKIHELQNEERLEVGNYNGIAGYLLLLYDASKFFQEPERILLDLKKRGILISSHNGNYIEEICDRVVLLKNGGILENATVKELRKKHKSDMVMYIKTDESIKSILVRMRIEAVEKEYMEYVIIYEDEEKKKALCEEIVLSGIEILL